MLICLRREFDARLDDQLRHFIQKLQHHLLGLHAPGFYCSHMAIPSEQRPPHARTRCVALRTGRGVRWRIRRSVRRCGRIAPAGQRQSALLLLCAAVPTARDAAGEVYGRHHVPSLLLSLKVVSFYAACRTSEERSPGYDESGPGLCSDKPMTGRRGNQRQYNWWKRRIASLDSKTHFFIGQLLKMGIIGIIKESID